MAVPGKEPRLRGTNVIHQRLNERLTELGWGSVDALTSRLRLMATNPGYEKLGRMIHNAISKARHNKRPITDYELAAVAEALDVDIYWLLGLSDSRERPAQTRKLLKDH